jgi:hypothetical protein
MRKFAIIALITVVASIAWGKDKPAYQVGTFMETRQQSDGTYSHVSCGLYNCSGSAYSAAHNVHEVQTPDGVYTIEAPVSVGGTLALAMLSGSSPIIHKEWFMDNLHEGDQVLFSAQCNKHNHCTIRLPNPDKPDKVIETQGFFFPSIAKTNVSTLCGKGKLTPEVEAQVCNQPTTTVPAIVQPAPAPAPAVSAGKSTPTIEQPQVQQHQVEGYTISGSGSDVGSVSGDQISLGEAARRAKLKKQDGPR